MGYTRIISSGSPGVDSLDAGDFGEAAGAGKAGIGDPVSEGENASADDVISEEDDGESDVNS